MNRAAQKRSAAPLIVGAMLLAIGLAPRDAAAPVRVERLRVDPGRAPAYALESLEGLGRAGAARIAEARREFVPIDAPRDLALVPGVGTRLLHRWHRDLAFPREAP